MSPGLADRGHCSCGIVVVFGPSGTLLSFLTTSNCTPSISRPGNGVDGSGVISHNGGMASAPVAVDARYGSTRPHEPNGYILSYGVSYKGVSKDKALDELPTCPLSATAAHDAFVSKCGFSSTFSPTLNEDVTKSRMVEDVRRVATTVASHDVVVLYFSGHGKRMDDTECVIDSAGCVVSVRKLQAVFAETVVERDVGDVAFVVILDCCQTLSCGTVLALVAL